MNRMMSMLLLTAFASPSIATAGELYPDRRVAAYDECLMVAAVRASYTSASNDQIFDLARSACTKARTRAMLGNADQRAALGAAEAYKAANLPNWVDSLRERRRTLDAVYGAPEAMPR